MAARCAAAILFAGLVGLAPAAAQEGARLGRIEFNANCAQCHGISGRGDGIIAHLLTVPPPDLTGIQRANGGVFPFTLIYDTVESGGGVSAHGTSEMPAWGARYAVDVFLLYGIQIDPLERDAFIRSRILALVEYVATLQAP